MSSKRATAPAPGPGSGAGSRTAPRAASSPAGARERVLLAAARVFRESGYRAASLDEILRLSQVSKSNLYYHFKGKLELAVAVLDLWAAMVGPRLLGTLKGGGSGLERMRSFAREYGCVCCEGAIGCPFGMLAAEEDLEPPLRERVQHMLCTVEEALAEALRDGQRDGSIRSEVDPRMGARALVAALQGGGLMGRALREPERVADSAGALLDLFARS